MLSHVRSEKKYACVRTVTRSVQKLAQSGIKPDNFTNRIIFMSMYNDIDWSKNEENFKNMYFELYGNQDVCKPIRTEEKWYGPRTYKPEREWNCSADVMTITLKDSGHPVCRTTSALDERILVKPDRWKNIDSLQR